MFKARLASVLVIMTMVNAAARAQTTAPADVERLVAAYSTQRLVELDVGETFTFKLNSGAERVIRLVSVREQRDRVVSLVRRADVRIEIDGRPAELSCAPYVMPTVVAGMRIQADRTAGWGNLSKQVQLSLWNADDPIVNTRLFGFPLGKFRLLSQGTQAYDEPVHLGAGDDDPQGQRFYHDYGVDLAGFEGREEVIGATDGTVVKFWPSREDLCSVIVQDPLGFHWEYGHLSSAAPETVLNAKVAKGQKLGMLGRAGPSGNFSHLHVGSYLTRTDLEEDKRNTRLNLYPWLVATYQAQHPKALLAVARPHHLVLTGDTVEFDGSNSLPPSGGKIVEWRWVFHDRQTITTAHAERVYDRPGAYVAELWIKDDRGSEDVDICQVKVYSKADPETAMPHIFMTYTPTVDIRPDQAVTFRFWFQGDGGGPITVEFDDGARVTDYQPYAELQHAFKAPGIHIVAARCEAGGKPIMQELKVVVEPSPSAK